MKICPVSNIEFKPKRSNQIYYSASQRIFHNNQKSNDKRKKRAFVEKPLITNHNILEDLLNGNSKMTFHKEYLLGKGYNFSVFTHYSKYGEKQHPAIYNYLLFQLNDNMIQIIKYND